MDRQYALDANVLISSNRIVLVDKVRDEIYRNEDQLSQWLKTAEASFIIKDSEDKDILPNYSKIIASVQSTYYNL